MQSTRIVSNTSALGAAIGIEYPLNRRIDFWSQLWTFQFQGSKLPYYYAALALFVLSVTVSWRIEQATGLLSPGHSR